MAATGATTLPSVVRASRNYNTPSYRTNSYGFRIVRPLDAIAAAKPLVATTAKPSASPTKPTKPWNTPAFQLGCRDAKALPAEKQIEAVSKKLMELNPGFDGKNDKAPKIERGVVTGFGFSTDNVTDISPVRALAGLKV